MLNWEIVSNASQYLGTPGQSKTTYFGPDENAIFGRYYDGTPISEHPKLDEISRYFEFWIALSNDEQREVLQGMFDAQIAMDFVKAHKDKDAYTIVTEAIKWWDRFYEWEVKEFMQYLAWKKGTLRDPCGYDVTRAHKFKGSIPQRVKQFVLGAKPELIRYDGKKETQFEKIFYSVFSKALIGGN